MGSTCPPSVRVHSCQVPRMLIDHAVFAPTFYAGASPDPAAGSSSAVAGRCGSIRSDRLFARVLGVPRRLCLLRHRRARLRGGVDAAADAAPRSHHRRRQRRGRRVPARTRDRRRGHRTAGDAAVAIAGAVRICGAGTGRRRVRAGAAVGTGGADAGAAVGVCRTGRPDLLFPLVRVLSCLPMVLVPALALGATFPLAIRGFAVDVGAPARRSAMLYATNTAGAAVGALVAGFVLIPVARPARNHSGGRRRQHAVGAGGPWSRAPGDGAGPWSPRRREVDARKGGTPRSRMRPRTPPALTARASRLAAAGARPRRGSPRSSTRSRGRGSWRWCSARRPTRSPRPSPP